MELDLQTVIAALKYAFERHGFKGDVVPELDADSNEGDTYRLLGQAYRDQHRGTIFRLDARSPLFTDYPDGFALYQISDIQRVTDDQVTVTVRVGKIGEVAKRRVRAEPATASSSIRALYDALRALEPTLPEFDQLNETKARIFISQIQTLRLTMKM